MPVIVVPGNPLIGPRAINAQTGISYTLTVRDSGKVIACDNANNVTLTVPAGLGVGFTCRIAQLGEGAVIPTADGVTISQRQGLTMTGGPSAVAALLAVAANTFILSGDLQ